MKSILFLIIITINITSSAQFIKHIAVFHSGTIAYSGIFGTSDTAVYNYSTYYQEWLPLSNSGFPRNDGQVKLGAIAIYNDGTSTTEGLFVVSDTAVFRYSWYLAQWLPLSTQGLIRINDTVQIGDIYVYQNGSLTSSGLFTVSDTAVFQYSWYYQQWNPLSNNGLNANSETIPIENFYEIQQKGTNYLEIKLPPNHEDALKIAIYDLKGSIITKTCLSDFSSGKCTLNMSSYLHANGYYLFEISGTNFKQAKKIFRFSCE
ncbi:MAG TPA: hypothetical protein DEH02_06355 [Bacteroidales bacterium]|nr:MAG: hypothetical protein A2X01_19345 [Bacteroidetes bacterium GWF2_35_48]OFY99875.1 MAG: hypothetical protein A2491_01235 [Bacteroidetes bacterium RIFOXYC12_FULL_35_7]HBX50678.1 hypothetical protein [Bacteroidales bacterium]